MKPFIFNMYVFIIVHLEGSYFVLKYSELVLSVHALAITDKCHHYPLKV